MSNELTERELLNIQRQDNRERMENDPNTLYADSLREEKINNILSQISPDTLLSEIEHRIRGEKKNIFTSEWEPIAGKSYRISEEMIGNFMSFLGSILNQNTTMSNFSSGEINNIMNMVIEYITDDLDVNSERYGLQNNYTEMTRIGMIILNTVFTVLKRAQNGMEGRRVFGTLKVSETLNPGNQKKGIIDALSFWK